MQVDFSQTPERLGIAPAIVGIITAAATVGTTVAALVAAKRRQRETGKQTNTAQANELKRIELEAKFKAVAQNKNMQMAAIIGIPAALAAFFLLK